MLCARKEAQQRKWAASCRAEMTIRGRTVGKIHDFSHATLNKKQTLKVAPKGVVTIVTGLSLLLPISTLCVISTAKFRAIIRTN